MLWIKEENKMLDGMIVINKPKEYTSHDVVSKVKKIVKEKVGHTGTLDPNATGVLPLLIGQGTKLSHYLTEHDKEYIATLALGIKTDTADGEGNVIEEKAISRNLLEENNVKKVISSFVGKQKQIPPMYSAIKVNGKKLYEYARKNEKVEIQARDIEIYEIQLLEISQEKKKIVFRVKCSKGTYIRTLCEDIANQLETVGYMKELQRTKVGQFDISKTITIEELEQNINNKEFMEEHFITIEQFFRKQHKTNDITLNKKKLSLFLNGVQLTYKVPDGLYRIYTENKKFVGIGLVKNNLLKREIIVEKEIEL